MNFSASFLPTKQIERHLAKLNWDQFLHNIVNHLISIILAIISFIIILWVGKLVINTAFRQTKRIQLLGGIHRAATFHALTLNIYRYTCYFSLFYALLSLIGVPVGTLIASAGIFSIALGLGAQGFVSDVVSGFFLLLEKQIDVGNVVKIDSVKGTVVAIGLRTTQVLTGDGILTYIQNRNISMVQNFSRHELTTNIDLKIAPTTPLDQLNQVIKATNQTLIHRLTNLVSCPTISGPTNDKQGRLVFRITVTTEAGQQGNVTSACLTAYLKNLASAGIQLENDWKSSNEEEN